MPKRTRFSTLKQAPPWLIIAMVGVSLANLADAQETPGGTTGAPAGGTTGNAGGTTGDTGGTTGNASGTTGNASGTTGNASGTTGNASGTQDATPPPTPTQEKPRNPFGLPDLPSAETKPGSLLLPGAGSGASSAFGSGLPQRRTEDAALTPGGSGAEPSNILKPSAPTFTAPGGYGGIQKIFDTGQGRFTRPRFRYGATFKLGFDDNVLQTPDDGGGFPEQEFRQVIPAQPEISDTVTVREFVGLRAFNSKFIPVFRTVDRTVVLRPGTPEQEIVQVIPGIPPSERIASVVSGLDATMDIQWAKARSLFTFDLGIGADYYWNRTEDPLDYNGRMSLVYIRRFGPRLQFSASASASYASQPDYSNINVAQTNQGSYFTGNVKFDLGYRWSNRFSTNTSLALNTINYIEETRSSSNYWGATLGNEFRYRWSVRMTGILEARYAITRYFDIDTANSDSIFLLLGTEWAMSRRFRGSLRLGETIRKFETSGISRATPYGEMSLTYQKSRRDQFTASARYGFENTNNPDDETTVLRTSLAYSHAFSPRLNAQASLFYIKNDSSSSAAAQFSRTSEIYDSSLGLSYLFSRRFSMSTSLNYTLSEGDNVFQNYDRTRFFVTGEYNF